MHGLLIEKASGTATLPAGQNFNFGESMLKLHFAPNSRAGRIVWLLEDLDCHTKLTKWPFIERLKSDEHQRAIRLVVCQY